MLDYVSAESRAALRRAGRNYTKAKKAFTDARAELAAAIVAERKDGTLIEDITADVPYRQTQVNRILEAAGLTEKRPRAERS
jgi:hypothetical protein